MPIRCDVLIAGGGPAGLAAAIALRKKGLDVVVADALRPPIDKACGEGLMPDARSALAALGIATDSGAPFYGISFLAGLLETTASFERGPGVCLRRPALHSLMVDRCHELGVRLRWGSHVHIAQNQPLKVEGEECIYRYAIGADGQSSRMRSAAGLGPGRITTRRYGERAHFRVRPWSRVVEVHWSDYGQAYIWPISENEVGVATVARDPKLGMEGVLASLPVVQSRLNGAATVSRLRGALTTTRALRRVTRGNVILIGDASGSVDAVTGEGLGLSFRQAALLAQAVDAGNLEIYETGHPLLQRTPHLMSRAMLCMDTSPWLRQKIIRAFSAKPELFAHLLAFHLGQRPIRDVLFRDAPLLGLGLLA